MSKGWKGFRAERVVVYSNGRTERAKGAFIHDSANPLPKWYRERQKDELKEIYPLFYDLKVLSELRKDAVLNGNCEDYKELKEEILDFHYRRLGSIRETTLDMVKKQVLFDEIKQVI